MRICKNTVAVVTGAASGIGKDDGALLSGYQQLHHRTNEGQDPTCLNYCCQMGANA